MVCLVLTRRFVWLRMQLLLRAGRLLPLLWLGPLLRHVPLLRLGPLLLWLRPLLLWRRLAPFLGLWPCLLLRPFLRRRTRRLHGPHRLRRRTNRFLSLRRLHTVQLLLLDRGTNLLPHLRDHGLAALWR